MNYQTLVTVSSVAMALLGLGWTLKGRMMLSRWRLVPNEVALLVGRRIGTVYLGLAVLLFALRRIAAPDAQAAVCAGAAGFTILLALVGLYEYFGKRVGPAMLVSVTVEVLLAVGYVALLLP